MLMKKNRKNAMPLNTEGFANFSIFLIFAHSFSIAMRTNLMINRSTENEGNDYSGFKFKMFSRGTAPKPSSNARLL